MRRVIVNGMSSDDEEPTLSAGVTALAIIGVTVAIAWAMFANAYAGAGDLEAAGEEFNRGGRGGARRGFITLLINALWNAIRFIPEAPDVLAYVFKNEGLLCLGAIALVGFGVLLGAGLKWAEGGASDPYAKVRKQREDANRRSDQRRGR